jgi:hypothetical protein
MSFEFRDLCILRPEYDALAWLVQAGRLLVVAVPSDRDFSMKMLVRKGLAEVVRGEMVPTALGQAAVRARKSGTDAVAVYISAGELAAAAASPEGPPGGS